MAATTSSATASAATVAVVFIEVASAAPASSPVTKLRLGVSGPPTRASRVQSQSAAHSWSVRYSTDERR